MGILVVGLTGGIASGKSAVGKLLARENDIVVVDADRIAWETYNPGTEVYKALTERFGEQILNADRTINRKALGKIVFNDEDERQFLNGLVHPAIYVRLTELLNEAVEKGAGFFVVEAALLLEKGSQGGQFFQKYIMVLVDRDIQIERVCERDGISRKEAELKISKQMDQKEKAKLADFVINNSGDLSDLEQQVKTIISELRALPEYSDAPM